MTKLSDIFAPELLTEAQREGWVSTRPHPTEPLAILNYTAAATYARAWNDCTLSCRGLIYRTDTGEVVARPFRKFFNHHEPDAPTLDVRSRVVTTDKLDGSLGILYPTRAGWAIATRGSFDSEQAVHATEVWRDRYAATFSVPPGVTPLFEIVYPGNRIVVDYGDTDDLVSLGAITVASGEWMSPEAVAWPGPKAETFPHDTLADALAADPRPNAEGLVVYLPETGDRVKLKQEDYVALHRIVTGLNERIVWEHLRDGGDLDDLLTPLPEEFHGWVREVAGRLTEAVRSASEAVENAYRGIVDSLPADHTRKDFAMSAMQTDFPGLLFSKLDGKDYTPALWERVKPEAIPPRQLEQAA